MGSVKISVQECEGHNFMAESVRTYLERPSSRETIGLKTQGEIEAAVCDGIRRFETEYMGRGPRDIRAHLVGDMVLVRLTGVLTAAEQHLAESASPERGRDLLKQVRTHLVETGRSAIDAMLQISTGVRPISLHHDISTVTGEEVMVFTLAEPPLFRESKKR